MRVEIRQTGGLAGLTRRGEFDTTSLAPGEALDVEEAIRRLLDAPPGGSARHPDSFTYELAVTDGTTSRTVTVGEREVSEPLRKSVHDALVQGGLG
jgi:hypothetical protein